MDKESWRAAIQGVTKSRTQLSMHTCAYKLKKLGLRDAHDHTASKGQSHE